MPTQAKCSVEEWLQRLEQLAPVRCDLDVLLRDQWRHRIVARDDGSVHPIARRSITIDGPAYAALKASVAIDGERARPALALAALHTTLAAFGQGSATVIALLDQRGPSGARLLPSIIDHRAQGAMRCADALAALAAGLKQLPACPRPDRLLGRGLFDTALVWTRGELDDVSLPPAPLVALLDDDGAASLQWTIAYAADLFDDAVIGGVLDVIATVFDQYARKAGSPVHSLELVTNAQRRQLAHWNRTEGSFPQHKRLNELVEEAARRTPDGIAVVCGDAVLDYRQLDERANQLAHWLLGPAVGATPGARIGLYMDKSELGVIATLAIWKAGAAYVPIDPEYPAERARLSIVDTVPAAIICNRRHLAALRELLADCGSQAVITDIEGVFGSVGEAAAMPCKKPALALDSRDLAYITYTSGTTGVPKGVPKEHRSVVNSITDLSRRYHMRQAGTQRVALFASYVFEPHLRQTLIALINGQTLVVVPDDVRLDPERLSAYLAEHRVSYLNATGSLLQHVDLGRCTSLEKLLLVGEELTSTGLARLREQFGGRIINEYAFTESAFVTAIKEFPPGCVARPDRSIGRPLRNITWYILSPERKQLPVGAIGELYIGGCGVAPGYLNQEALTAKAFFPNLFQSAAERARNHNPRMYRTGDLARMLPNGEVEYMGRADFQLKINGVRVEPGEVEMRVAEYPGVRKCVVVAHELSSGDPASRRLVGYYTANPGTVIAESDLLDFLLARLVKAMVPMRMIRLDRMPLNINGKVDRRALPAPDSTADFPPGQRDEAVPTVRALRGLWSETLRVSAATIRDSDDFFHLGGNSIDCIVLASRIRRKLGVAISVEDLFRLRTLAATAAHLHQAGQVNSVQSAPTSGAATLLANSLQQGLLYHASRREDGDDAYVVQALCRYRTTLDPARMKQAWLLARSAFPSLRLRFEAGEDALQVVGPDDGCLDWRHVDLVCHADPQAALALLCAADRGEPYHPLDGALCRVYFGKLGEESYFILFSCHHLIIDGWSLQVLSEYVHRNYLALAEGRPTAPEVDQAYLAAQRYWQAHRHDHLDYWATQLARIEERADFSGLLNSESRYRVALAGYGRVRERKCKTMELDGADTAALGRACIAYGVMLHSVLQFAWHKALHAMGGGRTTVVGTIVSGRSLPVAGIETSVGLYINTLPLVVDHLHQASLPLAEAINEIQHDVTCMNARSIVELGRLRSDSMKLQLFDTLLVLENYPRLQDPDQEQRQQDLLRYERVLDADRVDHPLAAVAREADGVFSLSLWYAGEIMDEYALDTLLAVVRALLLQVARGAGGQVSALSLLPAGMAAALDAFNRTEARFLAHQTLSARFEEVAAQWPEQIALVYQDRCMSYRELNAQANRMARRLRGLAPLGPDVRVALVLNKGEAMIIAMLAVWKAGAAYVPVDPAYPDERIAFMLQDCDACLVLVSARHAARVNALALAAQAPVADIDALVLEAEAEAAENLLLPSSSTDLAYAIYTSGTTGQPKAVLVEHRGVANLQQSLAVLFKLDKRHGDEAMLTFSNYVFDHFVEVMTDALLNGQKLVLLDDAIRTDERALCRCLNRHQVTYLSGTPSVLSMYDFSQARTLRRIDAIGEEFTAAVFASIRKSFPDGVIINGYGPTEISITSHKRLYGAGEQRLDRSIGFQVANTYCYVLDGAMQRVPIGGVGELYIGGAGVARGYLKRPELTAQRFIADPFAGGGARLYRTGDLARWLPNGELEYLGRTDLQVKINGLRVELGEVEAALAACPGVSRAVVISRERQAMADALEQKYLIGYYMAQQELDERELKRRMRQALPAGLVPARVLRITAIPVTASGKLDAALLPEAEPEQLQQAPADPLHAQLRDVWSRILGIAPARIGVNDDFFTLGGDSMRAMALAHAATRTFCCDISVSTIFQATTVALQALHIAGATQAGARPLGRVDGEASALVSFAQERLLFIDALEGGTSAYNIAFTLSSTAVTQEALVSALGTLLGRHAALRTLLRVGADGAYRLHTLSPHDASARFQVDTLAASGMAELEQILADREGQVFRLGEQLPWLATVISVTSAPAQLYLSLVFHHSCFDGCSWDIWRSELAALLRGTSGAALPPLAASYADYAGWQRRTLSGARLVQLEAYWRATLAGCEALRLSCDLTRPARFDYRGQTIPFKLDMETANALRALARRANASLYSVLLAGWCQVLRAASGQYDQVIATPFANRGKPEFAGVIGLMTNLLAIRVRLRPGDTLGACLQAVAVAVQGAQAHADLPFERMVRLAGGEQDPGRPPLAQVNFTMLPWSGAAQDDGILADHVPSTARPTSVKFELSVMLQETREGLAGSLTYASSLFSRPASARLVDSLVLYLERMAQAPGGLDAPLPEVLLPGMREPAAPLLPLHVLFECEAAKAPAATALVCGASRLTYGELNERANRLARQLRQAAPLRSRDLVALVLDKSELMVIAMLAVWKAGAAYVPIDPACPDARIAFLLEDTGARLLLASSACCARLRSLLDEAAPPLLDLECLPHEGGCGANLDLRQTPGDLAYAIYTSGTTGQPKAVLVTHRNAASFHRSLQGRYFETAGVPRQTVLFLSNYVFDFSIEQLALSILSGNKLLIAPVDAAGFYECAASEGLTFLSGTPMQILQFDLQRLPSLRSVVVAGEAFLKHQFDQIRRQYAGNLYNAYGTTETTVYNTVKQFAPGDVFANDLGKALPNTRLHILDEAMQEVALGGCGQLHIAGECVSDGYLNRLALTSERFTPNQRRSEAERLAGLDPLLYKTGDMVRRASDGTLQYLGRNDQQLKLRGLRIEPGEIEAAIMALGGVRQCTVVAHQSAPAPGSQRLIAYYLPEQDANIDEAALLSALRARLAPGTVPTQMVRLVQPLPLTINGKLDMQALPEPPSPSSLVTYAAPRDRMEARLCQLWGEQIPAMAVGIDDDFFRCGGDSIGALRLASMVQHEVGTVVTVKQVFDFPTVRALASQLRSQPTLVCPKGSDTPEPLAGACPMLPVQRWFFAKPLAERSCWNQNFVIHTGPLDAAALRTALGKLVEHHDAFWLRYRPAGNGYEQRYAGSPPHAVLHTLDVRNMSEVALQHQLSAWQAAFDLEHGPLYCATYLHGHQDGSDRIWFAMHHLITDVVSWRIVTRDLEILYHGGSLGPRRATLRAWAQAVEAYRADEAERRWWSQLTRKVAEEKAGGMLAVAAGAPVHQTGFLLAPDDTARLVNDCSRAYGTDASDLLLTALGYGLRALTGRTSNLVTVESHGREQFDEAPEVRDCVGWFTTMHPLPLELGPDLGVSLLRTQENRRKAPLNGLGYGALHGNYGNDGAPLPAVSFNYLGLVDAGRQDSTTRPAPWRLEGASLAAPVGEAASDCAIDVTMYRRGGQLATEIRSRLDFAATQAFAAVLQQTLHALIAHAAAPRDAVAPDIAQLCQEARFEPYVLVNESAAGGTLFMLPPGEGGAESYLGNIAAQLPRYRLVVFNNLHLHAPRESFEALASYYLKHIERLQAGGGYSLLGWSFGGVLALEIANQLARAGKEVANLFVIDAYFHVPKAAADLGLGTEMHLLDPIHYHYAPSQADLDLLGERIGKVVLFKAEQPNEVVRNEVQRLLFAYYQDTSCNYLDSLLPRQKLRVEFLRGQTHHSWVLDQGVVSSMCRLIEEML